MKRASEIYDEVEGILLEMHIAGEVYISNGQMGDIVTYNVTERAVKEGAWDTDSIRRFIKEDANVKNEFKP